MANTFALMLAAAAFLIGSNAQEIIEEVCKTQTTGTVTDVEVSLRPDTDIRNVKLKNPAPVKYDADCDKKEITRCSWEWKQGANGSPTFVKPPEEESRDYFPLVDKASSRKRNQCVLKCYPKDYAYVKCKGDT